MSGEGGTPGTRYGSSDRRDHGPLLLMAINAIRPSRLRGRQLRVDTVVPTGDESARSSWGRQTDSE